MGTFFGLICGFFGGFVFSIMLLEKHEESKSERYWFGKESGAAEPNYESNGSEFGGYASAHEEWAETC